jgi:hypothetical protein
MLILARVEEEASYEVLFDSGSHADGRWVI